MLDIQKFIWSPKIIVNKISDSVTSFEIQQLPRGFGHTLGNALRRIILAYNIGGAITGLVIKGVSHEYQVIDGVKESVLDMMLNFKKLRFKVDENSEKIQRVSLRYKGNKVYTSADLKLPNDIQVLNEEEYLFEITDPSLELNIDIRVEKGYGYYSIETLRNRNQKEEDKWDINTLLIDNDFAIVDYATYTVQEIIEDFSGTTKDTLHIDIKTRYSQVSPKELIMYAGEVLASYAKLFIFEDVYIDKSMMIDYNELEVENTRLPEENNVKTMPIDALPLSERTRNALIKNDILYVEDLEKKKKAELLLMKGVGRKAIEEINSSLSSINKALIS
jgi:DNA-directed RNA polymerase subunit alpha